MIIHAPKETCFHAWLWFGPTASLEAERQASGAGGGLKGFRKVARPSDGKAQHLETQRGAGPFHLLHNDGAAQIVRIIEHGHASEARQELREQLEPLGAKLVGQKT